LGVSGRRREQQVDEGDAQQRQDDGADHDPQECTRGRRGSWCGRGARVLLLLLLQPLVCAERVVPRDGHFTAMRQLPNAAAAEQQPSRRVLVTSRRVVGSHCAVAAPPTTSGGQCSGFGESGRTHPTRNNTARRSTESPAETATLAVPPPEMAQKPAATVDAVFELSQLLNTGLDRRTVQILMALLDTGVHPDALAKVVLDLRAQAKAEADATAAGGKADTTTTTAAGRTAAAAGTAAAAAGMRTS